MSHRDLPDDSHLRWRRLDAPGRERARIERLAAGWRLTGELALVDGGVAATLRYAIACDAAWRTRTADVEGAVDGRSLRLALAADGRGAWRLDGRPLPALDGALDVDLGVTPATNLLPIRRLALAGGEARAVRAAWLRFPELRLEPLEQTYRREGATAYRYVALVDGAPFTARLDTDAYGRVLRYEGLWAAEPDDAPEPGGPAPRPPC